MRACGIAALINFSAGLFVIIAFSNWLIPVISKKLAVVFNAIIARNIFASSGGDLVTKHSAQITERNVTALEVR
jgi:hypothetical protein